MSALVTGGGRGIGRAVALRLAAGGTGVTILDLDPESGAEVVKQIRDSGQRAQLVTGDVSLEDDVSRAVLAAVDAFGPVGLLVNNAAAFRPGEIDRDRGLVDMDPDVWDRMFAVNVRGAMLMCKHVVPVMAERGGGVVLNMASRSAFVGDDRTPAYGCSKAALISLTRYVATMYGHLDIRCNAVAPASVRSVGGALSETEERLRRAERLLPDPPLEHEVAEIVEFLASGAARSITGQVVVVDAGVLAHRPHHSIRSYLEHPSPAP